MDRYELQELVTKKGWENDITVPGEIIWQLLQKETEHMVMLYHFRTIAKSGFDEQAIERIKEGQKNFAESCKAGYGKDLLPGALSMWMHTWKYWAEQAKTYTELYDMKER